jgi:hypothetical protein
MEIIVTSHPEFRHSLIGPSLYARFGIMFTEGANMLSPLSDWVEYKKRSEQFPLSIRMKYEQVLKMIKSEQEQQDLQKIWNAYRAVQKQTRKTSADIVFIKRIESRVIADHKAMYWGRYEEIIKRDRFDVFEQCTRGDGLFLHFYPQDETDVKEPGYYFQSHYLRYDFDQGEHGPCLYVVCDEGLDHLMDKELDMFHFLDLPNIAMLNYEGLMACRHRMRPVADALAPVARQWWEACTAPGGPDPEKLRAQMEADVQRLCEQFDPVVEADPDIQWLHTMMPDQSWNLSVKFALCPYPLLMEALDLTGVILPATAKVLEQMKDVPGPPPYVPIMVLLPEVDDDEDDESGKDHAEQPDEQPTGLRSLDID